MFTNLLQATELSKEGQSANPKTNTANSDPQDCCGALHTYQILFRKSVLHLLVGLLGTMRALALSGPPK